MTKTSITEVDHTYNEWLRNLDIYEQELDVLKSHLDEINGKNLDATVSTQIAGYNSRIKGQKQNIRHLRRTINENIMEIAERTQQDGEWYVENKLGKKYRELHEEFTEEMAEVNKLKQDFNAFSAAQS
jgi:hypothetical protein